MDCEDQVVKVEHGCMHRYAKGQGSVERSVAYMDAVLRGCPRRGVSDVCAEGGDRGWVLETTQGQ